MAATKPQAHEPHPDPQALTSNLGHNSSTGVDFEPHPEHSIELSRERQGVVDAICRLYSGSAGERDMHVYAERAVYDDPWSSCDARFKIAGQWYGTRCLGIPMVMATSRTLATEVVASTEAEIVFKLRQEHTPRVLNVSKVVNSLVSLAMLDVGGEEKVVYHNDMWNEKDYSHEGLGKIVKTLNGDHLTTIT